MMYSFRRVTHAVWSYLNQSITPTEEEYSVWKPSRFWYIYKIRILEKCWLQKSFIPAHEIRGQDEYRAGN
ncbi:hypothetical protein WEU38_01830 [Cyanobacterium aponinum AL20118]|uniref:Uncharacterized protein n=3 Tax=Cyanobacterium aponinum TaxID=379064 RepID=K9Z6W0_CYAAP|nr:MULTISPECIES: hypothetical protein [Cyanobacterium]AFZ54295.1 hypothetical protein Cyan10605_2209 [Cyanobacterium aponinum PCC 10605]MBD2393902.1 hypothetical protein [Cyanobacterium aponinum FACHB-4101]PHV62083.1 hypothetical protein CSQ80_12055 [Cyanobacterium aponinum IPPAS B-1201]WPF89040.1 hypothetical protein SAY89_01835 [Cyanobacterium aponinum AL20115]WRL37389.1 hypothetical protein VKI22_12215 [Cyanobacterium aponinum UTEX 3221]